MKVERFNLTPAARAAIDKCREILGGIKPDPWRWRWRNELTASQRDNLLWFAGVRGGNLMSYAAAQWDELPAELRAELPVIWDGFKALARLESQGRIKIEARPLKR